MDSEIAFVDFVNGTICNCNWYPLKCFLLAKKHLPDQMGKCKSSSSINKGVRTLPSSGLNYLIKTWGSVHIIIYSFDSTFLLILSNSFFLIFKINLKYFYPCESLISITPYSSKVLPPMGSSEVFEQQSLYNFQK